jgi:hypothetical protein
MGNELYSPTYIILLLFKLPIAQYSYFFNFDHRDAASAERTVNLQQPHNFQPGQDSAIYLAD